MWHLALQRTIETQSLLANLPNRHVEKIAQKELAVSIRPASKAADSAIKFHEIRRTIRKDVSRFKEEAPKEYQRRRESTEKDSAGSL